jgi:hypothetical protein
MALEIGAESASLGDHCIYSNINRKPMGGMITASGIIHNLEYLPHLIKRE